MWYLPPIVSPTEGRVAVGAASIKPILSMRERSSPRSDEPMRRARSVFRPLRLSASACAAIFAFNSCRGATEIVVEVTTNVSCTEIVSTTVTAASNATLLEGMAPKAEKAGCDGDGKIGRLVVLPTSSDGDGDDVAIRVVTGVNKRAEDCTPE